MRDRIALDRWADRAADLGLRRLRLERPDPDEDPDIACEFVQLYMRDPNWARWGLAPTAAGYLLWDGRSGANLACCATLDEALAVLDGRL